ncbi:alkylation response protein AidB-like acyl-CoA dehydrogenase [Rhodococcus sp. 27YEA15]|uniref:acyl-CoA dehydrogenase family protein n=1 Tax=Rhodococcus sp. 27YEA15 TaxID=3156259 RepID=UPI003C7E7676
MTTTSIDNSVALDEFLHSAKTFLEEAAPRHAAVNAAGRDSAPERVALFPDLSPAEEAEELRAARAWRQERFDAGFGWPAGPTEFGGAGLSPAYERAYLKLERNYQIAPQRIYDIGLGMVAPTLLAFGTDVARRKYLQSLYRGDIVACQLFSEPGAGSDLSSIATRAVRDGDEWLVNGQKIWSSGAHLSSLGLLVCRTGDPDARHRNLTAFALPMDAEGVDVRPIRQMTGGSSFNEVFLNDVRISDDLRLGEVDKGWDVVIATLMNERAAVGGPAAGGSGILSTERLAALLNRFGRLGDDAVRDELMRLHTSLAVSKMTRLRSEAKLRAGQRPGPEMSIGKLALTNNLAAVSRLVSLALGPRLIADSGEVGTYMWSELVLGQPGLRIGGGTDEVQRNILAERVLGLPR